MSADETRPPAAKQARRKTSLKRRIAENELAESLLRLQKAQERERQRSREKLKEFMNEN